MKKQIISASMLVVGFLVGATALSTIAAWSEPTVKDVGETDCNPPHCNVQSPINVGATTQFRTGKLGLGPKITYNPETDRPLFDVNGTGLFTNLGVLGSLSVSRGASSTAGSFLMNDGNGVASWSNPDVVGPVGDSCNLIAETSARHGTDIWQAVDVPKICKNNTCSLLLASYNAVGTPIVQEIRATDIIQYTDTARVPKNKGLANWWAKTGSAASGAQDQVRGRNGVTNGDNLLLEFGTERRLYDDNNDAGAEMDPNKWSLRDNSDPDYLELYACN